MQTEAARKNPVPGIVAAVGGLVLLIAAFMPWVTVGLGQAGAGANLSVAGTEGDGVITLIIGLILLVAGIVMWLGRSRGLVKGLAVAALVLGVIGAGIALYDITSKDRQFDQGLREGISQSTGQEISDEQLAAAKAELERLGVEVNIGIGMYLTVLGGLLAAVGGILGLMAKGAGAASGSAAESGFPRASAGSPSVPPPPGSPSGPTSGGAPPASTVQPPPDTTGQPPQGPPPDQPGP